MIATIVFVGFIILLLFIIATRMENTSSTNKTTAIRSVYFYLASFITLGIVIGSLVFLVSLGLRSWVFTDAEPDLYRTGPPPSLYLSPELSVDDRGELLENVYSCTDECELTATHLVSIEQWESNYELWETRRDNPNGDRARDAVGALSFLIVSLPFFIIHFRIAQRDAKTAHEPGAIRTTYFYLVSLGALLMMVIAGGILINTALKTWVFPSAGEAEKVDRYVEPVARGENDGIMSIINCSSDCELSEETQTKAEQWLVDMEAWRQADQAYDVAQNEAAGTIPYVALGIPLFWYHWQQVRREKARKEKTNQEQNN